MNLLQRNAECLATLVGVVLYENLKGVTETLGIGFAAAMFGIVLTAAGVIMTLIAKKGAKGTATALAIHAALWILRGVIGWLAGVAIACFIIYRLFVRPGTVEQKMKEDDTSKCRTSSVCLSVSPLAMPPISGCGVPAWEHNMSMRGTSRMCFLSQQSTASPPQKWIPMRGIFSAFRELLLIDRSPAYRGIPL